MTSDTPPLPELVPEDDLLRALLNKRAVDNLPDAFLLRDNEKDSGLSVSIRSTASECRALFSRTFGVAQLTVSQVTELELAVVPDEPHHANIVGIPHKDDDADRAEWFASRLAERATIIDRGKVERE